MEWLKTQKGFDNPEKVEFLFNEQRELDVGDFINPGVVDGLTMPDKDFTKKVGWGQVLSTFDLVQAFGRDESGTVTPYDPEQPKWFAS